MPKREKEFRKLVRLVDLGNGEGIGLKREVLRTSGPIPQPAMAAWLQYRWSCFQFTGMPLKKYGFPMCQAVWKRRLSQLIHNSQPAIFRITDLSFTVLNFRMQLGRQQDIPHKARMYIYKSKSGLTWPFFKYSYYIIGAINHDEGVLNLVLMQIVFINRKTVSTGGF